MSCNGDSGLNPRALGSSYGTSRFDEGDGNENIREHQKSNNNNFFAVTARLRSENA